MKKILVCLFLLLLCGCKQAEEITNTCKLQQEVTGESVNVTYTSLENKIKNIEIVTIIDCDSLGHEDIYTELEIIYESSPYFGQNAKGIEYEISSVDNVITKILRVDMDNIVIEKLKGLSIIDEELIHGDESEFYIDVEEFEEYMNCK